ncbi:CAAX prenyl protease 2 isoform X2 [Cylas formicarius]|uniref:CAAX prenyl protease 2 isoform X2 n=1 Tax=Cylas formicarius TaxID=197179 RepID=UPI0029588C8A|nr:CAAX prenyl protease 2 isoform X2 [Cylas formicarius]
MEHGLNAIFGCVVSVGLCLLLSVVYLASLHVWNSPFSRDHPTTIKKRFVSVFFMLFVAPCFLYIGLDKNTLQKVSFLEVLGVKSKGLWQALIVPLLLTVVLFLGPISMEVSNSLGKLYAGKREGAWHANFTNLIWIRNHLVAPFSEEFTYRSCMLPLLLQCFPATTAIAVNPLLFGIAHFHHVQERVRFGMDLNTALKISCFQFVYTTIFGAYSAYLLYRTGHFASIFVVHAFCNHMGFPDVLEVATYPRTKKVIVSALFVSGFAVWYLLLEPLTTPDLYSNRDAWYHD